jgi:WD40 repeat protein
VVVSGSHDATVRVWDAATGAPVGDPFTGHTDAVYAVAVGQVGGRAVVVSGSNDRTVRVWDAATGAPFAKAPAARSQALRPPHRIDLACPIAAMALDASVRLVIGAELGVACLRLPN